MRKITLILFLVFYSLGTMLLPMGDMSCLKDFSKMYHHCEIEDPQMTPAEFVFEHLLNLDCLDCLDLDGDRDNEHEKPHQWFFGHPVTQVLTVCASPISFPVKQEVVFNNGPDYQTRSFFFIPRQLFSDIFRPPIA